MTPRGASLDPAKQRSWGGFVGERLIFTPRPIALTSPGVASRRARSTGSELERVTQVPAQVDEAGGLHPLQLVEPGHQAAGEVAAAAVIVDAQAAAIDRADPNAGIGQPGGPE